MEQRALGKELCSFFLTEKNAMRNMVVYIFFITFVSVNQTTQNIKMNNARLHFLRLLLGMLLLYTFTATARTMQTFITIDNSMGLCSNTINNMITDQHGFVWLCTPDGLCRYDGLVYKTYRHDKNNPYSIAEDNVHICCADQYGLWVGAGNNLQYFDYNSGNFKGCQAYDHGKIRPMNQSRMESLLRYKDYVLATDFNGNLYAKKDGEMFFTVVQRGIYALCRYNDHAMVGLRKDGICLLSTDGRKILSYYHTPINTSRKNFLYYSHNNKLLYYGNGIGEKSMAFNIQEHRIMPAESEVLPPNLMAVTDLSQGCVAFGMDGEGIIIQKGNHIEQYTTKNSNLSSDAVFSLLKSPMNTLWVGSYRGGLNMMSNTGQTFRMLTRSNGDISYDIVTAIHPLDNKIYMGLDGGGLCIYDRNSHSSRTLSTANSNLPDNHIIGMLYENKSLWLAVFTKGLVEYDLHNDRFRQFAIPRKTFNGNDIWSICPDGNGNIWVGGHDLFVFNTTTRNFSYTKEFIGMDCASILCKGNDIWAGTNEQGIYRIDKNTHNIKAHYSTRSKDIPLPSDQIRYIYLDSGDHLWVSTLDAGFFSINIKNRKIKQYREQQGLSNTNVNSINEDANGNLWMGTNNGLYRYHPGTGTFVRFGCDEHISSTFTYRANILHDNILYMGSTRGLLMFNPQEVNTTQAFKSVSLTSLDLQGNAPVHFNLYGSEENKLTLQHDQNFFTLHFSVPEYDSPHRINFSCKLTGLEDKWRELGNKREVTYTNVPPGTYEFMVRCTSEDGQWIEPTVLKLRILPPWYATWWATILWGLILTGILVGIVWGYLHEMSIRHKMQIAEVQRKTIKKLNEAKMDFYARATHELRTPVFLISAQIEELMHMPQPVTIPLAFLHSMSHNSKKLNALISRVIDIRKMDKVDESLNLQRQDIIGFCQKLTEDYQELCDQKHISYRMECKEKKLLLDFDREKLETIITNLISNAFKYSNMGGQVVLTITNEQARVIFSVADNGIGIQEEMRTSIFEDYFRTKRGERQSPGDGIGLATVKRLVLLHHGDIKVESEVNKGSDFIFFIPKNLLEGEAMQEENEKEEIVTEEDKEEKTSVPTVGSNPVATNPAATHSILIIDDEKDTIDLLERNLCADFKVFKAYDGLEGLKIAQKELPDIIVTDLMMPNMDGMEFLRTLKEDKKLQHIKVIIFTAKTAEEDILEAFDQGADAYLTKPISLRLLRKRIDRLVEQSDNAQLTADITRSKNTYNKEEQLFLLRCREIIDDNLQNDDFNIDLIADTMAMSHSSLYKKIKAITGMSLIEFINDYKVYKAVEMFRQGATNVDSVREKCGFKDAKNFRTVFKRKKGVLPKQFIQGLYQKGAS